MEDSPPSSLVLSLVTALTKKAAELAKNGNHQIALQLLEAAIASAEESVRIAPNSVYFAHALCRLLEQTAQNVKQHQNVINQCNKALQISQPTDPLQDDPEYEDISFTASLRISAVQQVIQHSIDHCNLAIREKIQAWWESLSMDTKKGYLKVRPTDIKALCNDQMLASTISEAIAFGMQNRNWKHWTCFICDKKFPNPEHQFRHLLEHKDLPQHLKLLLPSKLDKDWCNVIRYGEWSPIPSKAVREKEKEWHLGHEFLQDEEYIKDSIRGAPSLHSWELCIDVERNQKLETIEKLLQNMLQNKSLSADHVHKVTKFSINKLREKNIVSRDSVLWKTELHKNHACICLLGAVELEEIVKFLEFLYESATDNASIKVEEIFSNKMTSSIKEIIYCDDTFIHLGSLALDNDDDPSSAIKIDENHLPDISDLLEWCFANPRIEDELQSWLRNNEKSKQETAKLIEIRHTNLQNLEKTCLEKQDELRYMKELHTVYSPKEHNNTNSALESKVRNEVLQVAGLLEQCEKAAACILPGILDSQLLEAFDEHLQNSLNDGQRASRTGANRPSLVEW